MSKTFRIVTWGGIGDAIFLTPSLRALREQNPGARIRVYCWRRSHRDVLLHNPNVDALYSLWSWRSVRFGFVWALRRIKNNVFKLPRPFLDVAWGKARASILYEIPAAEVIAQMIGIKIPGIKPEIYLTPREEAAGRARLQKFTKPVVAIHIRGASTRNKDWFLERWADLVARHPEYTFVQLGGPTEDTVPGAENFRGLELRESFAVLKHCRAFVGIESGLSHVAAAYDIPGVVMFGASSSKVAGNPIHEHVQAGHSCAPCIDIIGAHDCPFKRACMKLITVDAVSAALRRSLARHPAEVPAAGPAPAL